VGQLSIKAASLLGLFVLLEKENCDGTSCRIGDLSGYGGNDLRGLARL
jgi:hypothetical protein